MEKTDKHKSKHTNSKNPKKITAANKITNHGTKSSKNSSDHDDKEGENKGLLNTQNLLERKKLHLVLDLDNTLIHCTTLSNRCKLALKDKGYNKFKKAVESDELHEILGGGFTVKLRPGAREFVKEASELFDLSIYTKSGKAYGVEVAKLLANSDDKDGYMCLFTEVTSAKGSKPKETEKELRKVMVDERFVVVVDDRVDVWRECDRENVIQVKPYWFFPEDVKGWPKVMKDSEGEDVDEELRRVLSMLKDVHSMFYRGDFASKEVRQVLKMVRGNSSVR